MDKRYFIVLGACMTQFMVIGLLFSFGLFFKVFEEEFGWSRALVSSGTALAMFMMGVLAIPVGRLGDRFGPRIVLTVSGALFGFGFAMISQISQPWHLLALLGLFVGLGMATHDVITLSTIGRWFERRRGIMTGIVKTGTAAGQVALPPLCAFLIITFEWRTAVIILGVMAGIALLIAARLVRPAPKPVETPEAGAEPPGLSFGAARQTTQFYKLCALQFCFFPTLTSIPLHIAVHGEDQGMTTATAATLLATVGGVSAAGRLIVGAFSDRIGGRNAYMLCFAPLICALILMIFVTNHTAMFAVAALYGFAHGGFFTVVSPTIAESFGTKALGAIFGVIVFCGTVGGAISPIVLGRTYDVLGTYNPGFVALVCLAGVGLVLAATLKRGRVDQP